MYDLVISGKAVDPIDGVYDADIGISKGKIKKISSKGFKGKEIIQLTDSQVVFPGFIDPHVHLREPGWEHKEDFLTGSRAALHGGVTTVGDMPNLPEPIINKERLLKKISLAQKSLIDILHLGGVNKHNINETKEIANFIPAFKIYTAESTGELTLNSWQQIEEATKIISRLKKPITFHCEDQEIINKAKRALIGKDYPWKHCDEQPPESETTAINNVLSFCKRHDTKANIAHISSRESLKLIEENKFDINLTCEVTPHHLYFTKYDMKKLGNLIRINCPLREEKDRKALIRGIKKGAVDMLATDHAPHTLAEKNSNNPPSGMPGLDTYGNFALWLMLEHRIKPQRIAEITSHNAAKYLGLRDRAKIQEGFLANLVILDKKGKTKITKEGLETKCRWSPFDGMKFPGKIVCTIFRGKLMGYRR